MTDLKETVPAAAGPINSPIFLLTLTTLFLAGLFAGKEVLGMRPSRWATFSKIVKLLITEIWVSMSSPPDQVMVLA